MDLLYWVHDYGYLGLNMDIENMRKAVEMHRPIMLNKYGHRTDNPEEMKFRRCNECHMSVPEEGCPTWKAANP